MQMELKSVAVYCGSSFGTSEVYREAAVRLGQELAERGLTLIYGGASVGLMGAVADAVLEAGGSVTGVIPTLLEAREISHRNLTELIVVDSMHERKRTMIERADGFIALPGGPGTMEELFEVMTWSQIGLHQKPFGLLNINGYYDQLIQFFDHMNKEGFYKDEYRENVLVSSDPASLLNTFATYHAPGVKTY
ncbi:TIGR00730 family Rossman fold protein [Paenibacillus sp. NPDC058071]|uniref:LOG family protein n=1 Tax=Paenibacillus sp. NPDC058071 TaxID=3346326 RepID=UPI0036DAEC4E